MTTKELLAENKRLQRALARANRYADRLAATGAPVLREYLILLKSDYEGRKNNIVAETIAQSPAKDFIDALQKESLRSGRDIALNLGDKNSISISSVTISTAEETEASLSAKV